MHLVWINERAEMTGGCERYIKDTVSLLHARHGVRSTLLYQGVNNWTDPEFTGVFLATGGGAYPLLDAPRQITAAAPDAVYVHRLAQGSDTPILSALAEHSKRAGAPVLRFFHDYQLLCLREHKYTAIGRHTCDRAVGVGCYSCLGFVSKKPGFPGIALRTVGSLQSEHRLNQNTLDGYVVASWHMARQLAAHGFPADNTHVLPLFCWPPQEEGTSAAEQRDPDLLFYAGQLVTGKGVDTLIEAIPLLNSRSARLVLAGTGRFTDEYKALAERLGVADRVVFAGRLRPAEMASYYRRARAVVVPSRFPEPFGLVGVEAMAYGAPVVATGVGGMEEWLDNGVTGLSAGGANNPRSLAEAMDALLSDPERAERMGDAARRRYEAMFRPERHIDALRDLFTDLIAKKRGSTPLTRKGIGNFGLAATSSGVQEAVR